jgi:hypothetical protein
MIEVSFPAGFAPADLTLVAVGSIFTRSLISSDSPARSASANSGASPANDTRLASSNRAAARNHASGSFTSSAFWYEIGPAFDTRDHPEPEGTFS